MTLGDLRTTRTSTWTFKLELSFLIHKELAFNTHGFKSFKNVLQM
jgi:hypothetical protein